MAADGFARMTDTDGVLPSSSDEDVATIMTGGVPMGRWKEGQLFDGIAPTPGLDRDLLRVWFTMGGLSEMRCPT